MLIARRSNMGDTLSVSLPKTLSTRRHSYDSSSWPWLSLVLTEAETPNSRSSAPSYTARLEH